MVDTNYKIMEDGVIRDMTSEEKTEHDAQQSVIDLVAMKLADIRKYRNRKLKETDYLALSDVTLSDSVKTWRQNLRNLPQDNSTEEEYDLLLARDSEGKLTHIIWEKP
mgnify:FL=1